MLKCSGVDNLDFCGYQSDFHAERLMGRMRLNMAAWEVRPSKLMSSEGKGGLAGIEFPVSA